jgi:hypothetical protein
MIRLEYLRSGRPQEFDHKSSERAGRFNGQNCFSQSLGDKFILCSRYRARGESARNPSAMSACLMDRAAGGARFMPDSRTPCAPALRA